MPRELVLAALPDVFGQTRDQFESLALLNALLFLTIEMAALLLGGEGLSDR